MGNFQNKDLRVWDGGEIFIELANNKIGYIVGETIEGFVHVN